MATVQQGDTVTERWTCLGCGKDREIAYTDE
jgi:hypothetical protein